MAQNQSTAALLEKNDGAQSKDKGNHSRIRSQIRQLLLTGGGFTAVELNDHTGGSDARKRISELRREGFPISDVWLDYPRCKRYFFAHDAQPYSREA